ncbi:acyl-CoA dehydrogenase family protein [Streptomyces sp. LX-29]|uniref:acyl-CoA dehydrogenase family protein n=1 Tax=Streptomyces sp. LX-29 TaxID=2900152 RepID=UPI00240E4232|nr:acyl-CoA dehydrogenase [Streptomyces sp. LX-29]WFB10757.1 acyl-CoA dehydrogenase family protein [Streptomyces sp. LX-29]
MAVVHDATSEPSTDSLTDAVREALSGLDDAPGLRRFPRAVLERLGALGVLRRRWAGPHPGDVVFGVELAEQVALSAPTGIAVGVSLHTESVLSILHRFGGDSDYVADLRERALDGTAIGALAASEPTGGSDLSAVRTLATPVAGGWRINGSKKYVSLGAVGDFVIVLCRLADQNGRPTQRLATVVVPLDQAHVVREHDKLGTHALDTVAVEFHDVLVPAEALLGRPGLGLVNVSYGLSFERLAVGAQVLGAVGHALGLAVEHSERREQFGAPLRSHQHLEFRLADVLVELEVLRGAVHHTAGQLMTKPLDRALVARVAAVKVHAARLAERLVSECLQVFGGAGYLTRETPLGQMWQDVRLARIGGGTDEMMLALVAGELRGAAEAYGSAVRITT